jgi:hypothetical protein
MRAIISVVFSILFFLSSASFAQEEVEAKAGVDSAEIAGQQMTILLKSYFTPATNALAGLSGNLVPFAAYILNDGTMGHHNLSGIEPTNDPKAVDNMVGMLYEQIYPEKDNYATFAIFAVTQLDIEGERRKALTVIMEHKNGVAVQRIWPFTIENNELRLGRASQIDAVNVIFK